jgi:hypothetical protein
MLATGLRQAAEPAAAADPNALVKAMVEKQRRAKQAAEALPQPMRPGPGRVDKAARSASPASSAPSGSAASSAAPPPPPPPRKCAATEEDFEMVDALFS